MGRCNDKSKLINEDIGLEDGIQKSERYQMLKSYRILIVVMILSSIISC